ncbi:exodeoxyribonuclease VII small subunit [Clostridium sp. HCP1S3_B4]|uniref:exodeoxyribonuclease VII small subunit n=1 Tax=unclassified Clostridium TaxID=2614128 RepID=UPI0016AC8772|nr:exodeoxyribonuclease VII small subunit [Clostridiales bacterium]MDY2728570.1 exodeoxyribonuclease VII small subunit [Clostridium sp.]NLK23118.1 exodeoxyribonuclease VII small subunit [Clostridiales bacterium]
MAKKESYEDLVTKLQNILNELENEQLNLDESMKAYEDGVKLVNKIYKILNTLEGKITVINENNQGENQE